MSNFNPRSHEGSDGGIKNFFIIFCHFNPRSHEGSDKKSNLQIRQQIYFNPRSHEGSDTKTTGADRPETTNFNPRSHEGSDSTGGLSAYERDISIHAPTRGATMTVTDIDWEIIKFQSTLPRGERREQGMTNDQVMEFQSTLPRGERHGHMSLQKRE